MPLSLDVPFLVYQAERRGIPTNVPHKHSNSAREASAFLMFIAEYYDCLPEVEHSAGRSWGAASKTGANSNIDSIGRSMGYMKGILCFLFIP